MSTTPSKANITEDPTIHDDVKNKIVEFGKEFPSNPRDGFLFTLTSKERRQQFIYDATNEVWQEVGNDSTNDPGNI
jgi:hypothetical protein